MESLFTFLVLDDDNGNDRNGINIFLPKNGNLNTVNLVLKIVSSYNSLLRFAHFVSASIILTLGHITSVRLQSYHLSLHIHWLRLPCVLK
jgi:hypothetical protein